MVLVVIFRSIAQQVDLLGRQGYPRYVRTPLVRENLLIRLPQR